MTVQHVRVGEVLELQRRSVAVEISRVYEEIGIRSFGRGLFHKDPVSGADLGTKRVFRIEPGDLIISNVFAWEGAIAVADAGEDGKIGSHRFMTFIPIDDRIDTSWVAWYLRSEQGLELIRKASPGSAGRNRTLAIDRFEALMIPLPPIDEQRRVADRLDAIRATARRLSLSCAVASDLAHALSDASSAHTIERGIASGWPTMPLSDVAEINPRPARLEETEDVSFVPMSAVDASTGSIATPEARIARDVGPGYKQFKEGDVIFARITPCMQNGKSAIFREKNAYGYGSTEFHVIRPGPELRAEWLHKLVRTKEFRDRAAERFTGTAGQQRVPADFLRTIEIPVPSIELQMEAEVALDRIVSASLVLSEKRRHSEALRRAIEPSALNRAFAGLS